MADQVKAWLEHKGGMFLPAIVTPLTVEGKLDVPSLQRVCKHFFDQGCAGLYVNGNTGEGMLLDVATRKQIVEIVVAEAKKAEGLAMTVIHVGHPRTEVALELAAHAKAAGASAVSSMPPFISGKKFFNVETFYKQLAAHIAPLPVIAYHIPVVTGMDFTCAELCALLDIPGVIGFKYTTGDLYKLECTLNKYPDCLFLHGLSTIQVAALQFGSKGGITGGGGNLCPGMMVALHKAMSDGDTAAAMVHQKAFNRIQEALYGPFAYKMVQTFKTILMWQGVIDYDGMAQEENLDADEKAKLLAAVQATALASTLKPVGAKPMAAAAPWDPNAWAAEPKKMPKVVPEAYRTYKDDGALMEDATDDVTAVRGAVAAPGIDSLVYIKDGPVAYSSEKPTVIVFWAKFAKGDYTTIVGVSDIADDFKEQANFVGISVDPNVDDAKGFLKKMGTAMPELDVKKCNANYPLAWDEDKKVKNAFMKACRLNSLGASATFIVDKKGNFIWREQFGQGYAPKKGQLREQLRRHCAGEGLLSNGNKPVAEEDDEDLADGDMDCDYDSDLGF